MNGELRTEMRVVRRGLDPKERRKRFKTIFSRIRKISAKFQDDELHYPQCEQDIEPMKLALRVVFHGQGYLPTERLVKLHNLIKTESNLASEVLNVIADDIQKRLQRIDMHCAIRHPFEEYETISYNGK